MKWNVYTMLKKPTCYVASGWFNPAQEEARQDIIEALESEGISYFSPKDEVLVHPTASPEERKAAFKADTEAIKDCDFVIASTVGKDMGTLMEMGMSYAWKVPFIVYFPAPPGTPCNLMIAESAYRVAQTKEELVQIIKDLKATDFEFKNTDSTWNGRIE